MGNLRWSPCPPIAVGSWRLYRSIIVRKQSTHRLKRGRSKANGQIKVPRENYEFRISLIVFVNLSCLVEHFSFDSVSKSFFSQVSYDLALGLPYSVFPARTKTSLTDLR